MIFHQNNQSELFIQACHPLVIFPWWPGGFVGVDRLSGAHRCVFKLRVMRGQTAGTLIWSCWRHTGLEEPPKLLCRISSRSSAVRVCHASCMHTSSPGKGAQAHVLAVRMKAPKHVLFVHHPLNWGNTCPQTWSGASCSNEQCDDHLENTLKKVPYKSCQNISKIRLK